MDNKNIFLITAFINSPENPKVGFSLSELKKMLLLEDAETNSIISELIEEKDIIELKSESHIILTPKGELKATLFIKKSDVYTANFYSSLFIDAVDQLVFGFRFYYILKTKNTEANYSFLIRMSDLAIMQLGLANDNLGLQKLLFQYAKDTINEKLKEGSLGQSEDIILFSADLKRLPNYNIKKLVDFNRDYKYVYDGNKFDYLNDLSLKLFALNSLSPKENPTLENIFLSRATQIIENRDYINVLFKYKHGKKLLNLPQEKNLLDLFKPAQNADEFLVRILSLGALARELNNDILSELYRGSDNTLKSVQLLKEYLKAKVSNTEITDILQNLGKIRNGYPAHTDYSEDVIKSHMYFKLEFPVQNFSDSWNILLDHYLKALHQLKEILLIKGY